MWYDHGRNGAAALCAIHFSWFSVMKRACATFIAASALLLATSALGASNKPPAATTVKKGEVAFWGANDNQITRLRTTLVVPPKPEPAGTLFLWPGLQPRPGGKNYLPIDNGVLQPVLTWGRSCAPGRQPKTYATWWISAQYVNTFGHHPCYMGCRGGRIISANPGDSLAIEMVLSGSEWIQKVRNSRSGKSVSYKIDLLDQAQIIARFEIELGMYGGGPHVADVTFTDTTISFARADRRNCLVRERGADDLVTPPVSRKGGRECYVEKIILKSKFPPTVSQPSCSEVPQARSISGEHRATIAFKNERGLPIRLCWINYSGAREQCRTISNAETATIPTYLTHPWIVTDLADSCMGLYRPSNSPTIHVIR